ncbi:hypothetical protein OCF56_04565 [Bacillus mycoides]|uniref:hypothetical protein n=1 Tax=Bacillus mycoides TaxID=1405 RepID=UPI0021CDC82F|nr:hypothetical protein [Bacillus mycoides]MCU5653178.1 hypothetical protein [Bacillus mycoides]
MKKLFSSLFGKSQQSPAEIVCYYDYPDCYIFRETDAAGIINSRTGNVIFQHCGC